MKTFILDIQDSHLVVFDASDVAQPLKTARDIETLLARTDIRLMRSSSLDFPEAAKATPMTLALIGYLDGMQGSPDFFNTLTEEPADVLEACPACGEMDVLSDEEAHSVIFYEPVCTGCRNLAFKDAQMDDFDRGYERARANGWAD